MGDPVEGEGASLKAPTVNLASLVWGIDRVLRDRAVDPQTAFARAGLSVSDLDEPDRRVPLVSYLDLLETCADLLDDPLFGLRFGLQYDPRHAGVVGNVALASRTIGEALAAQARYLPTMVDSALFGHRAEDGRVLIFVQYYDPLPMSYRQKCDWTVGFTCKVMRVGLGDPGWRPDEIQLPSHPDEPPDVGRERSRLLGAHITGGHPWMGILFDAELMSRPMATADVALSRLMSHYGDLHLSSLPAQDSELDTLRREAARLLVMGRSGIDALARSCGLSVRTLQRRLKGAGLSYSDLLDDVRHRIALNLLANDAPVLTEIAFSLGYSEVSAFHHAFRRWEGVSPGAYRKTQAAHGKRLETRSG